jgi:hypothetical protein
MSEGGFHLWGSSAMPRMPMTLLRWYVVSSLDPNLFFGYSRRISNSISLGTVVSTRPLRVWLLASSSWVGFRWKYWTIMLHAGMLSSCFASRRRWPRKDHRARMTTLIDTGLALVSAYTSALLIFLGQYTPKTLLSRVRWWASSLSRFFLVNAVAPALCVRSERTVSSSSSNSNSSNSSNSTSTSY